MVTEAAEDKDKLLQPSSARRHKALGKKSSKYRRPPSHLRELSGEV